ncbi:lipoprotein [Virgibacillus doumboii]|uniref:lipoprotein n=1 Tax=Virgibacillus doumboii TaxID=2697503 RepID=UPI0013DEA1AA|nr:lipoprotein [Virgibacillus doumboii]
MKRILISLILLLAVLSACNTEDTEPKKQTETNYYLSLYGESDHWKLAGYEIMMTPEGYKAGNGMLKMKDEDRQTADFLSYSVYAVVDGQENRFHGGSVSGEADITEKTTGTIEGEEEILKEFQKIDEIYMTVTWNDDGTDGDQEEIIILYNKDKNGESFLDSE